MSPAIKRLIQFVTPDQYPPDSHDYLVTAAIDPTTHLATANVVGVTEGADQPRSNSFPRPNGQRDLAYEDAVNAITMLPCNLGRRRLISDRP